MHVQYAEGGEPWQEAEDRPNIKTEAHAQQWAADCIQRFNDTLRPHEKARTLVAVTFPGVQTDSDLHIWSKTNLVTQIVRNSVFDTMMCYECGITAKRFGVGNIVIDPQYKSKAFMSCAKTKILLAKRAAKVAQ